MCAFIGSIMVMNNAHDVTINYNIPVGQGVALEPFLHQVAGRATMMCLNKTTVCKPLNYREHFFYKSLPPDIMQFTPQFKGVVNINIEETSDGNITVTAYPIEHENETDTSLGIQDSHVFQEYEENDSSSTSQTAVRSLPRSPCKRIRLKRTGSLCVDSVVDEDSECSEQKSISSSLLVNPWIFKVHQEGLKRHLRSSNKVVKKCILLENVASQFRRPCVLDLKMGTRVYGDYDAHDKRLRQERKCAATTTNKLGFRLSGMQVFNTSSGKFVCRDKYYGNKLDTVGLRCALHQFFHDGNRIRHELLLPVLKRLRSIRSILEQLRSYRFYASSLLIMYDGEPQMLAERSNRARKSCCDSEKLSQNESTPPPSPNSEANISVCNKTNSSSSECSSCEECTQNSPPTPTASDSEEQTTLECCKDADSNKSVQPYKKQSESEKHVHVDIRMIDFAKSTHQDMDSSVIHDGPDHGYIFGLTNLIKIFKEFRKSAAASEISSPDSAEV